MNPERWREIDDIFQRALEREPAERADFLAEACAGDAELRAEVEALLSADESVGDFISAPAARLAASVIAERRIAAMTGRRVSHYEIVSPLGAGGMGEVYLAADTRTGRRVALKLLPEYFNDDPERVRRFQQEARAVLALNHPNIVTIYEIGQEGGAQFIASEFINGATLRERMDDAPMSLNDALDVATQIADALDEAHRGGVVHRDIKPENVMLRPDGYVKVLDFGIAKLTGQSEADAPMPTRVGTETHPGMVLGTLRYMSPEQARGLRVDASTDIWSLGVLLYEMLARRVPFAGETPSDCLVAIVDREPPPLADSASGVPPALEAVINKALRKNPAERFQTAREMSEALGELKHGARAMTKATRATRGGAGFVGRLTRHHAPVAIALVALALLSALAAYKFFASGSRAINSVAVLPFVNASDDPDAEYLSDGVTESIINSLSQAPNLKVIARSSVFRYKAGAGQSSAPDPREVARALKVQAVLLGRVVRHGDELLVSAELVNADDDRHLWGAQYNRKVSDVFAVQEEIARAISQELRLRLTGDAQEEIARRRTDNLKAFEFYTRGRAYIHRRTREDLETAARFYEQAINEDPNYALAYAGLAEAYGNLGVRGYIPPAEGRRKLEEAARRAVALDPNLAEAHVAVGYSLMGYAPYDFPAAERELRRATELSPSLPSRTSTSRSFFCAKGDSTKACARCSRRANSIRSRRSSRGRSRSTTF
jgi:serine/threonine protein kinase